MKTNYCSTYYLLQDGREVQISEQADRQNNCSYDNVGMIVRSHFTRLAASGIVA
ncbi:hypothetical protein [Sphingobacterium sp. CZ-UAM]|uniref:hypothetical protein n=1 Tax=Sphingobacterium sp. CZ-UAM TaxID=1933868 RepID=UPI00158E4239|nr:hypothetical protein [Sphingobacterium sp. CZ-UAM]